MKTSSIVLLSIILFLFVMPFSAFADRDKGEHQRGWERQQKWDRSQQWDNKQRREVREERHPRGEPNIRFRQQFETRHRYPREGFKLRVLPEKHHVIHYRKHRYFYWQGVWYSPVGVDFVVIRPPLGIIVPVLPPFYTTIWVGDIPYYYANDVYYVWRGDLSAYEVVDFPEENEKAPAISYMADKLFVYPKKGQSKQQQSDDEYACHRYGVEKTGYDPTQPSANVSNDDAGKPLGEKRKDYQRAMKSCLVARDYSVE